MEGNVINQFHNYSILLKQIILNPFFQLLLGLLFVTLIPIVEFRGIHFWEIIDAMSTNTLLALASGFVIIKWMLWQFHKFPGVQAISFVLPITSIIYLLILAFFLFSRIGYSRHILISGFVMTQFWFFIEILIKQRYKILTFGLVPFGKVQKMNDIHNAKLKILYEPKLPQQRYDGIVADLHALELDNQWINFLAQCTLHRIPVYHIKQFQETVTGRIQIDHLSENQLGTLLPSPLYSFIKRLIDLIIVISTIPITLPIILITAIAIKIDSSGNILFKQIRIGHRNQTFKIYKFRSMSVINREHHTNLSQVHHITRVGWLIRKTRIDELPQLLNILKGDMSFIGPRPLAPSDFITQYQHEIPFYAYRHVIKPGMTGWAQVMQGHTSSDHETIIKVQYDFYYIKHFSFWLDLLILLKTIRVIFTGFGAK